MKLFNKAKRLFSNFFSPPKEKQVKSILPEKTKYTLTEIEKQKAKKQVLTRKEIHQRVMAISKDRRDEPTLELIKVSGQVYNHKLLSAVGSLVKGRQLKMMAHANNQIVVIKKVLSKRFKISESKLQVNRTINHIELTLAK